jgi:hypothetical protein
MNPYRRLAMIAGTWTQSCTSGARRIEMRKTLTVLIAVTLLMVGVAAPVSASGNWSQHGEYRYAGTEFYVSPGQPDAYEGNVSLGSDLTTTNGEPTYSRERVSFSVYIPPTGTYCTFYSEDYNPRFSQSSMSATFDVPCAGEVEVVFTLEPESPNVTKTNQWTYDKKKWIDGAVRKVDEHSFYVSQWWNNDVISSVTVSIDGVVVIDSSDSGTLVDSSAGTRLHNFTWKPVG